MTEHDLFRRFYGIARATAGKRYGDEIFSEEKELMTAAEAARQGFSNYQILRARHAAAITLDERAVPAREPSRHSAAIQLAVHSFGRVRRCFA
ncbi:hypothetical protein AN401_02650 [Zobellella denitrificans]|uniref:Uncharacterized protein n=1 Tax=Zobellella denitrificans TaxID=347534 RepID=A0A291HLB7_9GAMM|nr:hypothetical protein [Zobellella denitrificans]ATG72892.1 hypothetical protein AN401_02650 [Zobellella denitrificans]